MTATTATGALVQVGSETKSHIAGHLYVLALDTEEFLNDPQAAANGWAQGRHTLLEHRNSCWGHCCALMELGLDTAELQWLHDRIAVIADRADRLLSTAARGAG